MLSALNALMRSTCLGHVFMVKKMFFEFGTVFLVKGIGTIRTLEMRIMIDFDMERLQNFAGEPFRT